LLSALWFNVESKLISGDLPKFEAILKDMFYGLTAEPEAKPELEAALAEAFTGLGLKPSPRQMKRAS